MNFNKKSKIVSKVFVIVLAILMIAGSGIILLPASTIAASDDTITSDSVPSQAIDQDPVPPFITPNIPPFERVEEKYNITLVKMSSPTGPLYEGYRKPIQVTLRNKADHNVFDINVDIYHQLEDNELVFLTDLFYGCIPKEKDQTKTFTWEPKAGTNYLSLNITYIDNGIEQWNEEEFGFHVCPSSIPNDGSNYNPTGSHNTYVDAETEWNVWGKTIVKNNYLIKDDGIDILPVNQPYIYYHHNDINIKPGGHLIFEDCSDDIEIRCDSNGQYSITVEMDSILEIIGETVLTAWDWEYKTYDFIVKGSLVVTGTSSKQPVIQWMNGDINDAAKFGGIQLHPGSHATFDYAEIKEGRSHNIYAEGATITMTNTKVLGAQTGYIGCGIYAIGGSVVNIQNSNLSDNGHSGIYSTCVKTNIDGLEAWDNIIGVYLKDTGALNPLKKPYYEPGIDLGYYIWVDDDPLPETWHIRWSGEGVAGLNHRFKGLIYTSKPIISHGSYDFETPPDSYKFTPPSTISFQAEERIFEDGIDFTLIEPGDVTFWDLEIDGATRKDLTFVGAGGGSPKNLIFSLWHQPTISNSIIMLSGMLSGGKILQQQTCGLPAGGFMGVALSNSAPYIHDVGPVYSGAYGLYSELSSPIIEFCNFSYNGNGVIFVLGSPAVLNNMFYKNSNAGGCGNEPQIGLVECSGIIKENFIIGNYRDTKAPPPQPGQEYIQTGIVGLISSTRIESNTIKEQVKNIMYLKGHSGVVISNDLSVAKVGIEVRGGDHVLLDSNTISGCGSGIWSTGISNSRVYGNNIDSCGSGIDIYSNVNIKVTDNTISSNRLGLAVRSSDNVLIYHNNFLFNTVQAYNDGFTNSWDNGYGVPFDPVTDGGNYWSDWTTPDNFDGPVTPQTTGSPDGIVDNPYLFDFEQDNYPLTEPWPVPRIPHSTIRINTDLEFKTMAFAEGWAGLGTESRPWIIENYNIDGTNLGYCIYIGNTTYPFIVRNNYLHDASGGVSWPWGMDNALTLYNTENGYLTNNYVTSSVWYGIYLDGASNNRIHGNILTKNAEGIRLDWHSNFNTVTKNIITDNIFGIFDLGFSNDNTIADNTVTGCEMGISVAEPSTRVTIRNNLVKDNTYMGIALSADCFDNVVEGNTISSSQEGIHLNYSDDNKIIGNTVSDCSYYGIYTHHSNRNLFIENNIIDNNIGINLTLSSEDSLIIHNNFIGNTVHAWDDYISNFWSAGPDYPWGGGNYWEGHACTGKPSQGGEEYPIPGDAGNNDWFPYDSPNGWL